MRNSNKNQFEDVFEEKKSGGKSRATFHIKSRGNSISGSQRTGSDALSFYSGF